ISGTITVNFDSASFTVQPDANIGRGQGIDDEPRYDAILFVMQLPAPAVEIEVNGAQFALRVHDEVRPNVAHPDIVEFGLDERHIACSAIELRAFQLGCAV